ncbi:hypothetical protein ABLU82_14640 [Klebsiella sp. CN_Kp105]|uniref:hypothetical protein n=1 Tax=Klebsiella sp. CN_Kp105 TaxID=3153424 RepID=UPI0032B3FAE3
MAACPGCENIILDGRRESIGPNGSDLYTTLTVYATGVCSRNIVTPRLHFLL